MKTLTSSLLILMLVISFACGQRDKESQNFCDTSVINYNRADKKIILFEAQDYHGTFESRPTYQVLEIKMKVYSEAKHLYKVALSDMELEKKESCSLGGLSISKSQIKNKIENMELIIKNVEEQLRLALE